MLTGGYALPKASYISQRCRSIFEPLACLAVRERNKRSTCIHTRHTHAHVEGDVAHMHL